MLARMMACCKTEMQALADWELKRVRGKVLVSEQANGIEWAVLGILTEHYSIVYLESYQDVTRR